MDPQRQDALLPIFTTECAVAVNSRLTLKRNMRRTLFLATLLLPTWARAEVLDKEFSLPTLLTVAVVAAIVAFRVARQQPWALAGLLPIVGTFFWLHLSELLDPFVGPAMVLEGGQTYVIASWGSPLLVVGAAVIGLVLRVRHAKPAR
jgi:hypothetical protein